LAAADDVSRVPPKTYAQILTGLLTPAKEVLDHRFDKGGPSGSAVGLLYETVRFVDESGRACTAIHQIYMARDDQGVNEVAKDVFPYRKSEQKIHLVLAQSVQPDGSSQEVSPNAVLTQTPQSDADASLYSDYAELVVIYPNVRANTVCESIVVIEDQVARIPGEYTGTLRFVMGLPQVRLRHVLAIAPGLASRLTITPLGETPVPLRQTSGDGTVRLTWESQHVAEFENEPQHAPVDQVGPVVFLSTLKDWDAFGNWYRSLVTGRDHAEKNLARQIEERTRGLTGSDAIVAALLTDAARDVRYTGLEFGVAGLQPHDPNEVWADRYGDCKDKANLLRTMLREKAIPADLAFVNTEHAGLIEKRSPDYRHFDHMIVAVNKPGGGYIFCDPTIKYAVPGMLRPDDIDRDVLVLKDKGLEFVHTPAIGVGDLQYNFDLKLAGDGSVSGWLTMQATGYTGASVGEYYSVNDRQRARSRARDLLQGFYRAAELVDVDPMPMDQYAGSYRLRIYFTVAGDGAPQGREMLSFPGADMLLPDLGDRKARQTLYWQSRSTRGIHCRVQLPSGWGIVDPPRPFEIATEAVAAKANWASQDASVTANLEYTTLQNGVAVEQFPLLYNAVASLRSWLTQPLAAAMARPGAANFATTTPATQPQLADFPLMPTGEGQLDLLDRKYPLDGDVVPRRSALEQVLQWFPEDKETRFIAQVRLLELDQRANPKDPVILSRMRQLLAAARSGLEPDSITWGEYLLGRWLTGADKKTEALAIFTRLAGDSTVSDARRSWASFRGAQLVEDVDPQNAIGLLEGTISLDTDLLPAQFSELAPLLVKTSTTQKLGDLLESLSVRLPGRLDKVVAGLVDDAKLYASDDQKRQMAGEILAVLARVVAASPALAHLRDPIERTRTRLTAIAAYAQVAGGLKKYAAGYHPAWWDQTAVDPSLTSRAQMREAVKDAAKGTTLEPYIRYSLEYLTRFAPDPDDFGDRLWRLAASLNSRGREPELLAKLIELLGQLPENDRWRWVGDLLRADILADKGRVADALAIVQPLGDNPKADRPTRWEAFRVGGEYLERLKRFDDALASYKRIEPDLSANNKNCEGLLRAIFLNLERDNRHEALRVCGVLARVADGDKTASPNASQMRELVSLASDPAAAERFWKRQERWWPAWVQIGSRLGVNLDDGPLVPLVPDLLAAGRVIGIAAQSGDAKRVLDAYKAVGHAARWEPKFLAELAGAMGPAIEAIPQQQTEFRRVMVQALDGMDVADPEVMGRGNVLLAAYLIDTNRFPESLAVIKSYQASATRNDAKLQAMHRLWAIAAPAGAELEAAIASLQKDLDLPEGVADRPRTLTSLADAYRRAGARDKEIELLRRELNNAVIQADATSNQVFTARYQALMKGGQATATAESFDKALTQWMSRNKPSWYEFAQPGSLKDVAGQDLDRLLNDPPKTMLPAETAKIGFLIAQDPSQPMARRRHAFDIAVWKLAPLSARHDEFARLGVSIVSVAGFSDTSRSYWLYAVLQDGIGIPGKAVLRLHPLYNTLSADQHQQLDSAQLWGVDEDSADSVEQFAVEALTAPLNPTKLAQFDRAFDRLMQLSPEAAKRVYQRTENFAVAPGTTESAPAIRLRLLRSLRLADTTDAAQRAVARMVLDHYEPQHLQPPEDWREYRDVDNLELLDRRTALAIDLQLVRTHRFPHGLYFWEDLLRSADVAMQDGQFRADVLKTLLTLASSDDERSSAIFVSGSFLDVDQPAQRQQLMALVDPYRDPIANPLSSAAVREAETTIALRDGKPVDLDAVYRGQKSSLVASMEFDHRLVALLQSRDPAAIHRALEAAKADDLLGPYNVPEKLRALRIAGMNDEADLVREAGLRELYRAALRAWSHPNDYDIRRALKLAVALDATGQISQAWVNDCLSHVQNDDLKDNIIMMWAELHHDWAGALEAANRLIALQPTHYIYYWHRGNALFQIGHKSEAAAALTTYVHHCKDEAQYPDALEILEKMRGK
jgi:tetratricopeptide (TPR) repeat protein/transglutaminase-like putative cysteine protease